MKYILIGIIFTLISNSFASEMLGFFIDRDHPNKCVYNGLVLSPGEHGQPDGRCQLFMCDSADGFGKVQDCGVQSVEPPCRLGDFFNANAPYPDCCSKNVICPDITFS